MLKEIKNISFYKISTVFQLPSYFDEAYCRKSAVYRLFQKLSSKDEWEMERARWVCVCVWNSAVADHTKHFLSKEEKKKGNEYPHPVVFLLLWPRQWSLKAISYLHFLFPQCHWELVENYKTTLPISLPQF